MKRKRNSFIITAAIVAITLSTMQSSAQKQNDEKLLHVRETVWRARGSRAIPRLLKN
jgi:hypothetical protein